MSRRLLKTVNGRGVYEVIEEGVRWEEWGSLPRRDTTDPAIRLLAQGTTTQALSLPGGLYASPDVTSERRRAANEVLVKAGIRPRSW